MGNGRDIPIQYTSVDRAPCTISQSRDRADRIKKNGSEIAYDEIIKKERRTITKENKMEQKQRETKVNRNDQFQNQGTKDTAKSVRTSQ